PEPPPQPARSSRGGCGGAPASRPLMPIVRVNGVEIEPEAIAQETQNHPGPDPQASWEAAARALVVRELLLTDARIRGLAPDPESVGDGRSETPEESLVRQALEAAVEPGEPSDEECRRVYEGLQARFVTPTLFEPAHILIEPGGDDAAAWAEAEAEARAIIQLIGDSRPAFAEAAAARSACPTKNQGGSLGQIRRGELVEEVQNAIEGLAEGETGAEPVRSRFGWHVVRLERKIPGRALPFEVVQDRIRDMLEARAWAIGAAQYVAELADAAEIEGVQVTPPDAGFGSCADGTGC
ncbi:peptidylprolyl isomerase, partial [Phenylobacterium sp.]|uniref:peptidylprolyl isomerase n=1 Tax=Phenylobacterium sp. TaxID=1871053 RepID=UPI002FE3E19D